MLKIVKTDTLKCANGGYKVDVEEDNVTTFMLLLCMMMETKLRHTKASHVMGVRIDMTIEPVLLST